MDTELKQILDFDYMELLYEDDTVSIVNVLVMHEGINNNKCDISHEVILNALPTLSNKPICAIPNRPSLKDYSNDFIEHARNEREEKEVMIFGVFPESGVKNAEFVEKDGRTYLKVQAILFKKYSPVAMNIIKKRNNNCKISIEILAKGNTIDGIFKIDEFIFTSAFCLAKDVKEGIEGSSMEVIRFSLDEAIKESNEKYIEFAEKQEDKYKIPQEVKDNAQKGLDLRKEYKRGGTSVGINMAKYLVNNEYATYAKVKKVSQYFPRHEVDNLDEKDPPSNGWIAWLLWAGNAGRKWSEKIVTDMEKKEEEIDNTLEFIAKDLVGTESTIEIDKTKESLSDNEWGDENKSTLKKDCLKAKNYKALCKAVFLKLEDGWEEGKEGTLGYPVMEKIGDKVVYNRYGLGSAKAYATKNNEEEILTKLKSIYNHLDLTWDEENKNSKKEEFADMEKDKIVFSLNSKQMFDVFDNAISGIKYSNGDWECCKYWVEAYDESFVYLCDCEEGKTYKVPYTLADNIATLNFEEKVCVIRGGYIGVGENAEEVNNAENNTDANEETMEEKYAKLENSYTEMENKCKDMEMKYAEMEEQMKKYADLNMEETMKKNAEMESEIMTYKAQLQEYARKDEEMKMSDMLTEFSHVIKDESEMEEMKNKIKESTFADFETVMNSKIKEFAKNQKELSKKDEDKEIKNSVNVSFSKFGMSDHYDFSNSNTEKSYEEKFGVKINLNNK